MSASLDGEIEDGRLEDVLSGDRPRLLRLFSDEQRQLAHEWMLPADNLQPLGTVDAFKWRQSLPGFRQECAFELWDIAQNLRFLEVSALVSQDPVESQRTLHKAIVDRGIVVDPLPETKTRTVLERLAAAAADSRR